MRNLITFIALLLGYPALASAQSVEHYHLDSVGNVLAVTDSTGLVVEQHDYLPFGEECTTAPCAPIQGSQPKRFTGKERDAETGLDYFGARYYRANAGRFTSTDPERTIKENLVDPQRWNKYAYARNNPLKYTDPDGREVTYGSPQLQTFFNVLSSRGDAAGQKAKATLALYEGPGRPDLFITLGSPDRDVSGDDTDAEFVPSFAGRGSSVKLANGTITFDKMHPPESGDPTSEWIARHELGHADLAARDPRELLRLEAQSRNPDGSPRPHNERPVERTADTYAGGPDPRLAKKE